MPDSPGPAQPSVDAYRTLLVEESPDRLLVQLNRPQARNAINQEMVDELHAVCALLEATPKILILSGGTGSGDAGSGAAGSGPAVFASGADIAELRERRRADALQGINIKLFMRIAALKMPVIAALDGYTLGGGAELAYAADFRIGTPSVKIGNPETGLGILAAAGASWRLRELIGEPVAKEVLLAGRVLNAQEALALHLITELHEPEALMDAANALADRIAAQDQLAVQFTKALFHVPEGMHPQADMDAQSVLFESPAKFERMQAFLDRNKDKKRNKK
ncbi:enoyl-CoA hydratase/isomerase family protein [Paenarthrobacter sp. PH39-S1]|uniref:enoyl-CoA hydratase/isomerase family protein n=1 Tax=Paenarthrobacter sp. PH39-S1 TaxID=3046204 RepID=UPI0024B89EEA|nr:enoyl-CoA hydratase/isomerase family protein [Paenarthrobacter sp. PH39-S1]MDJ0355117.1 enoyl-CoA hydratase/isomerase family protein [Paenarthrobacter sp. PH39-S1]